MLGFYVLPIEYIVADLNLQGLPKGLPKGLPELLDKGFVNHDSRARMILLKNWFKYNKIENPNQAKKALAEFSELPENNLKVLFVQYLSKFKENIHAQFWEGLPKGLPKGYSKPEAVAVAVTETVTEAVTEAKNLFVEDSIEFQLAEKLWKQILKNNPTAKEPNLQEWSKDIDKTIRLDKRTPDQITYIIDWCQADSFWSGTLLSTAGLRRNFDKLVAKARQEQKKDNPTFEQRQPGMHAWLKKHGEI